MSGFPDTGPQPDGTRTVEQWKNAMAEDMSLIRMHVDGTLNHKDQLTRDDIAQALAAARKEAGRLERDIERFADEIHGLTRAELDAKRV